MTSPADTIARPLYEQIVTPGHVLSARLRTTLPTITRATVLAFALSTGAIGYFLAAGANSSLSRDVAAPASKRVELAAAAAEKFKFIGTAVTIPSDKLNDIVQIAEAKDAMNYIRGQLANGKFAFDAAMMTKIDGAAFASGAWTPGRIAVADAGDVVAFGMYVRAPFDNVLRWVVVARKFGNEFVVAEMLGARNQFALGGGTMPLSIASHPETLARIASAKN
jgi:hypothetical protein